MSSDMKFREWAKSIQDALSESGYHVSYMEYGQGQSSVNIDGSDLVGTITHWPEDLYEIQFNRTSNGEVVMLETIKLEDPGRLFAALQNLGITQLERKEVIDPLL